MLRSDRSKPRKIKTVTRLHEQTGYSRATTGRHNAHRRQQPLPLAYRLELCYIPLVNQTRPHQSTEEPVARRNLLERTSSVYDRWQPVQSIRKRATHLLFFTLTPLIMILLFSLGLWWVVWRVTSS
jgi:hypothetical protein